MAQTKVQREIIAKAIVPKIPAFLSLVGSIFIIQDILRSKNRRRRVYHRLLLGMSTFESFTCICNVIGTWAMPRGTLYYYGAMGNIQTCSAQGTFYEFGAVGAPLYNAALCMYYLLVIRYGWSEQRILSVEKYLHAFPIVISTFMAIVALPFKSYNPSLWSCWYAAYPITCVTTGGCQRGGKMAVVLRWLHYSLAWSSIMFVTFAMLMIWRKVATEEQATAKFRYHGSRRGSLAPGANPGAALRQGAASSTSGKAIVVAACNALHAGANSSRTVRQHRQQQPETPTSNNVTLALAPEPPRRRSNASKVATQAFLFVLAMYLSWVFATLTFLSETLTGKVFFPLLMLVAITYPSQGYFNVLVYLRPRYVRHRRLNPSAPRRMACWSVIAADPEDGESDGYKLATRTSRRRSSTGSGKATVAVVPEKMRRRSTLGSEPGRRCSSREEDRRRSSTGSIPMLDDAINDNFEGFTTVHFNNPALDNEGENGNGGVEGTTSTSEQKDLP